MSRSYSKGVWFFRFQSLLSGGSSTSQKRGHPNSTLRARVLGDTGMFWLVEERAGVGELISDLSSYIWISYLFSLNLLFRKWWSFFFLIRIATGIIFCLGASVILNCHLPQKFLFSFTSPISLSKITHHWP